MHAFPIPVVASVETRGPGSQTEDESLQYMDMPRDMRTYRTPVLPEPEYMNLSSNLSEGAQAASAVQSTTTERKFRRVLSTLVMVWSGR